jgi:hypothetical protein
LLDPGGKNWSKTLDTLFKDNGKLNKDTGGKEFDYPWDYHRVIGKMNYLEKSTRGDLAFSVHQCACYMPHLMRIHSEAVKRIGRHLLGTQKKGFIVQLDMQKSFECGKWDPIHSGDPNSAKSQTGYVILYHGCPVLWASRLQSVFALSTTKAEYMALSTLLRDLIAVEGDAGSWV